MKHCMVDSAVLLLVGTKLEKKYLIGAGLVQETVDKITVIHKNLLIT